MQVIMNKNSFAEVILNIVRKHHDLLALIVRIIEN